MDNLSVFIQSDYIKKEQSTPEVRTGNRKQKKKKQHLALRNIRKFALKYNSHWRLFKL
jgi:hypothetical protein